MMQKSGGLEHIDIEYTLVKRGSHYNINKAQFKAGNSPATCDFWSKWWNYTDRSKHFGPTKPGFEPFILPAQIAARHVFLQRFLPVDSRESIQVELLFFFSLFTSIGFLDILSGESLWVFGIETPFFPKGHHFCGKRCKSPFRPNFGEKMMKLKSCSSSIFQSK
jgi:hypothetical protein